MRDDQYILRGCGLCKSFGRGHAKVDVLRGLDLNVRRGEFLAVMGPSGCGKSTLVHVLGLITTPDSGQVVFDGETAPSQDAARTALRRDNFGFVFQRFNLLGVLTGEGNVAIALRVRRRGGASANGRVKELFEQMGVTRAAKRKPSQMSVGEQQRVAIVRALAHGPELLFADEPTGNLDSENSAALLEVLRDVNRSRGQTIVMITHSAEAASYADRIVKMKDGKIIDDNYHTA